MTAADFQWIGYVAAACTTFSFIPQVLHILRTRDTAAISLGMYSIFTFGVAMWLTYGLVLNDAPMIVANAITLTLALFILCYTLRDRRHQHRH
ncbi:MAG: glutathione synthetase [Gammaproteobacteria bacterium]|nr:MAG: glutathione synthetase [Gammaproteobacteria bacterium]